MERKQRKEWPVVTAVLIGVLLLPLVIYVGGYFWLPEVESGHWVPEQIPVVYRTYPARWLARIFEPAGRMEARLMGYEVEIGSEATETSPP